MERRKALKLVGLAGTAALFPQMYLKAAMPAAENNPIWENAWKNLGKFNAQRYQFRYVEPVKKLPKVFIYGDSISIGYTEYVRQSLLGKACVYRLHENGGASKDFISKMETFRKGMFQPFLEGGWDFEWDIIHFNVGLHDLKYLFNGKLNKVKGEQNVTLKEYKENIAKIIDYLQSTYPKAKLIFATTTPVPEGEPGRIKGDEVKYNNMALSELKKHSNIIINDLYTFSQAIIEKYAEGPGNVHYTPTGQRLQGIEVARVIAKELDVIPNPCPSVESILLEFKQYEKKTGNKQTVIIH